MCHWIGQSVTRLRQRASPRQARSATVFRFSRLVFLLFFPGFIGNSLSAQLTIAENGESPYSIVISQNASEPVKYAAEELQLHLGEISEAEIPILTDSAPESSYEILLGKSNRPEVSDLDISSLGLEGYIIRTVGKKLIIIGGEPRGTLYGVYGLLEEHLGCRWFTKTVSRIPKRNPFIIESMDEWVTPILEHRDLGLVEALNGTWGARNRLNGPHLRLTDKHGGMIHYGKGMFVHTFDRLFPPTQYFKEHPEYYSEIEGRRYGKDSQLCCTNEELIQVCIEKLRKRILDEPEATVFSISQNDRRNYCECANCSALAEKEGSQMAPVLHLVNRVAEALGDEFPHVSFETLSYQYTRKPPRTMRPRKNVVIRLCSIECCFMHPLETCDSEWNRAFATDLKAWREKDCRLWIWNYSTSFRAFLSPFPNLHIRGDNMRFFLENGATGVFHEDCDGTAGGELSELSGYISAKLLWNPDYNEEKAINEFLVGVYGAAAPYIREYIDMLSEKVMKENLHEHIWNSAKSASYLDDEILDKAEMLWDSAERMVEDQPDVLERVRLARLSVDFARIERQRSPVMGGECALDHESFRLLPSMDPDDVIYREKVTGFFKKARRAGVTKISLITYLYLDGYEKMYENVLNMEGKQLDPQESVQVDTTQLKSGLNYKYFEGVSVQGRDVNQLEEIESGSTPLPDVELRKRDYEYALVYTGYFKAPKDGIYTFSASGLDGLRMTVGTELVASQEWAWNNDYFEDGKYIALRQGYHPLKIEYFQGGGESALNFKVAGPGIPNAELKPEYLFREGD